jgi:hypothetical protein
MAWNQSQIQGVSPYGEHQQIAQPETKTMKIKMFGHCRPFRWRSLITRHHSPNQKKHTTYRPFQAPEKYRSLAWRSGNSVVAQNSLVQSSRQESDDDKFIESLERRLICIQFRSRNF